MSRFSESMSMGNAALLYATGDSIEYWPAGVEDDAFDIDAILTPMGHREERTDRFTDLVSVAEVQIWADDVKGVAEPDIKLDAVVFAGATWRITEVLETVGGMHRMKAEKQGRAVVGRGRGMR